MLDSLKRGKVVRPRHSAAGNGALLVLVDSSGAYHSRSIVDETVLVALEHHGLPYRVQDLARRRPTADLLRDCAGLVIAQAGLTGGLSLAEGRLVAQAVAEGMGLVNLDWDLRGCPGPLLEVFGFRGVERLPIASDLLLVPSNDHFITYLHQPRAFHQSQRMVTALAVSEWGQQAVPLVEAVLGKEQLVYVRHLVPGNAYEPKHYPVVFAARWGRGRAVQYVVNPRLWRNGALGHLGGLGDVWWRSIVWAARKPFVANCVPPFVTLSFDDCSGRRDFGYLEICSRHGYVPMASLFLDKVRDEHRPLLRAKSSAGEIAINTHAWDYYDLAFYDFGVGEFDRNTMRDRFAREDAFYDWLGAQPCRTVRSHWGEHGVRALPFHKERGQTMICVPIHIGEHKADQFRTDAGEGYWPYDTVKCFYDRLPDDNDFYIFGSFNVRHLADFLTGATILLRESPTNDLEKAAEQAAAHLSRGLENNFYGELVTHEHKFSVLTLDEWDKILARTAQQTSRLEKIHAGHDQIGDYLRGKDGSWIAGAERTEDGIRCTLDGHSDSDLMLSLFRDVDDGVERDFLTVPAFNEHTQVRA